MFSNVKRETTRAWVQEERPRRDIEKTLAGDMADCNAEKKQPSYISRENRNDWRSCRQTQETDRSGVAEGACLRGAYRSVEGRVVTTAQTTEAQEDGLDPWAGEIDAGPTAPTRFMIEAEARAG